MKRALVPLLLFTALATSSFAQGTATAGPTERRSWLSRVLHPFSGGSESLPEYKDAQLRGLVLTLKLSAQPVRLSETRQMEVTIRLINKGPRAVTLEFSNTQRFEIYLMNSGGKVLTAWSDNHAFTDEPSTILINPQEHIEYSETIATRELTPNKVFICEAYFPKYPELRVQQKFMTAP